MEVSMTLEQIRAALPTHIMLTPGVDVWREGDEYCLTEKVKLVSNGWQEINSYNLGRKLPTKENTQHGDWFIIKTAIGIDMRVVSGYVARRPIPPHILDNQAFWLRFEYMQARRLFTGRNTILINRDADDAAFAKGRLYEKWLLEQMEG